MMAHIHRLHRPSLALLLGASLALAACEKEEAEPAETTEEAAPEATEEEAVEEVELTFAFQPQENPEGLELDAERMAEFIEEQTGYEVEIFLPTNYSAVVEALRSDNADVAYFSGLPYLVAHENAGAELLVVEERGGNPFYYSQWYALADSDIESIADLKGRSIAFTSPTSTSGYLFPLGKVIDEGHLTADQDPTEFFSNVTYAGGYQQALLALVNGTVDAAAASDYALEQYLDEEQRAKVKVIERQGPVPTHGIAIRGDLPQEVKDKVRDALLALNEPENAELLKSVYGAESLIERSHDEHVGELQRMRDLVGFEARF
ncbi:phosphate/phosphite/phosphonate ABC transporter substrate-binding protein [Lujinxingia vulgaris]|uniref:Phosphate/phosphite/phosphonate ABC transporter substrate-binding protein n=1 Tax=Lujinxingia vulgaris TaxID=2600176 RepID=A0A5C6X2P2_9DELT|nr:phosphate/phosphite/phosphonate ABC transporter substrate-binding protein [Lujinxingia vulgaris]TXD36013.1 phosphate/phosphite/phosphonate ABC transporter substrate-binding protein [Lujinxingia vulgaris]